MKNLKAINSLIEIRTSVAILTSTISATLYGYFINGAFHYNLFIAMLICAVGLDALATLFNHIYDYYKAIDKEGYLYNTHNPIVYYKLTPFFTFSVAIVILGIVGLAGLYLVFQSSFVILWIGFISTLVAVLYSAGKIPIAYYPVSEFISGFFEGTVIFLVASFLQIGDFTWHAFFVSIPITLSISNIMLANNTVDIEEDRINKRITLPILIGRKKAIRLFKFNIFLMYVLMILFISLKMVPFTQLVIVLIIPVILKNIRFYENHQSKATGFPHALKNSLLFNLFTVIGYILNIFF